MPFKRPSRSPSASSSDEPGRPAKKSKLRRTSSQLPILTNTKLGPINTIKIYIVPAKLDHTLILGLYRISESDQVYRATSASNSEAFRFQRCDIESADILITAVRMRRRLERHLDWSLAKEKAIVTPEWLTNSAKEGRLMSCRDYAALQDLHEEIMRDCPDTSHQQYVHVDSAFEPLRPNSAGGRSESQFARDLGFDHKSRYACCRASPLVCPNQALVDEIDIVRRSRDLEGNNRSALSYERAISVIKAFPHTISKENLHTEVKDLPYLGMKLLSMIEEYILQGHISESQTIRDSERFRSLSAFSTIYGIGPHTARKLYAQGLRTFEDLELYYGKIDGESPEEPGKDTVERSIRVSLSLREEFSMKIPRDEVKEMNEVVMYELNAILKGCTSTIVGGYRRGKTESNDVDIIITHPNADKVKGLCAKLVKRLFERKIVTQVMHLSSFRAHNALKTTQWDSLEKALTVFILPPSPSDTRERVHRRLDLIFADPKVYWTAIVGWTGSRMFERDLRLWAKEKKGFKFDSAGITRRRDSQPYFPKSEQDVFETLGLEMVPPSLRNTDA